MKRVLAGLLVGLICLGSLALLEGAAMAAKTATVCPPVGNDTDCGTIIEIRSAGAFITWTGQGPYDGSDDTLVGVVNKTTKPISAVGLRSDNLTNGGIFQFDGDGISNSFYGLPGNAQDPTQYGGPHGYYNGITANFTAGIVNFTVPIPPGGSDYFSLENAFSQAHSCAEVVNNSITLPPGGGTSIASTFRPRFGYTIAQAAVLCGVTDFDWQQTITNLPSPSPFFQVGNATALTAPPAFNDPPLGGYTYETPADNSYPFYYDPTSGELATHETASTVSFYDAPSNPCLSGGSGGPCGGMTAPAGSNFVFTTHLVGVNGDRTPDDLAIGFGWYSTFNGTSGGISRTKNGSPVDPGSGTGGITVTSVQNTTTNQYTTGVVVTTVNGIPVPTLLVSQVNLPIVVNQSAASTLQQATRPIIPTSPKPRPAGLPPEPTTSPTTR